MEELLSKNRLIYKNDINKKKIRRSAQFSDLIELNTSHLTEKKNSNGKRSFSSKSRISVLSKKLTNKSKKSLLSKEQLIFINFYTIENQYKKLYLS